MNSRGYVTARRRECGADRSVSVWHVSCRNPWPPSPRSRLSPRALHRSWLSVLSAAASSPSDPSSSAHRSPSCRLVPPWRCIRGTGTSRFESPPPSCARCTAGGTWPGRRYASSQQPPALTSLNLCARHGSASLVIALSSIARHGGSSWGGVI